MIGSKCFFFKNKNFMEGEIASQSPNGFSVKTNDSLENVLSRQMLFIENFLINENLPTRPSYSIPKEEYLVLWNNERFLDENLLDIFRYYIQATGSTRFHLPYWIFIFSDYELNYDDFTQPWIDAVKIEGPKLNIPQDFSSYEIGQEVKFNLNGFLVEFSSHAINRTFERLQIHKDNFRPLLFQLMKDSSPIDPPRANKTNGDFFLYNSAFHWAILLRPIGKSFTEYMVVTAYEPPMFWRKVKEIPNCAFSKE